MNQERADETAADLIAMDRDPEYVNLARAYVELREQRDSARRELQARTRCPRCQRPDLTIGTVREHLASCMSRTDEDDLRDELDSARRERDEAVRDGKALVRQFENISRALGEIGWPSQNSMATERACDALKVLSGNNKSLRTTLASLRAALVEACDWAEQFGNARLVASVSDLDRITALRKLATAEGADE